MEKSTQARLEKSLARYVAMQTLPNNIPACREAIQHLSLELEKLGMVTHIDGPNHPWLVAAPTTEAIRKKHFKVLFVIHFDVVPADTSQFDMRVTKDRIYGRGVYDMKFAAACVKEMVADFAKERSLTNYDFGILITTDEEKGGKDGVGHFLETGWTCDIAVVPDGGYDWSLEARAKGFIYVYLNSNGHAAHSSRPWMGDNPIGRLSKAVDEITKHFPNADKYGTIVSINSLETNNSGVYHTTQIPQWAKAGISIRAYTEQEMSNAVAMIQEIASKHDVDARVTLHDPPMALEKDNPLVKTFISTVESIHGEPITFSDGLAASDARYFTPYHIPTVVMYPHAGDHHGPNEWLLRSDLYKYFLLCKTFVMRAAAIEQPIVSKRERLRHLLLPLTRR